MGYGQSLYIWQADDWQDGDWPAWRCDLGRLAGLLEAVSRAQGLLIGRLTEAGWALRDQTHLAVLTDDVVKTSEVEGDVLDVASVRSSIARRLGVNVGALAPADRHVDGVVEMVLDATARCRDPLTAERLFAWHAALSPTGYSGISRIHAGAWRSDAAGPMQVDRGPLHRPTVHYQAPPADRLNSEMARFLAWAETSSSNSVEPLLIRAGIAHLWFVTLHPFDDGNGRIARAVGDLFLARADGSAQRFYSLSAQIQRERKAYCDILERTQKGSLDITDWLAWFLKALQAAIDHAQAGLDAVLFKARAWRQWGAMSLNDRQVKMLNRLLDGFDGKLTSSKWATITKCSPDTALRDITELVGRGLLQRTAGGGRSTGYELAPLPVD